MYRVTPAGMRALRAWVGPPLGAAATTVSHDPLRSRARFLGALPAGKREAWADAALSVLDDVERRIAAWQEEYGGRGGFARVMTRSGALEVEARRRWLKELREGMGGERRRGAKK